MIGPRVLDPGNLAWLVNGDPSQHDLGWLFFRQSDGTFPPGLNPRYGLELASAIVLTDSNPLLALRFKPFAPWLPADFQDFGLWLLACFLLQGWLAWRLVGLVSDSPWVRAAGTVFFVFSPPMVIRMTGHLSLSAHFLVLAGLYLVFVPALARRRLAWGALLGGAVLVHAYLFAMAGGLWAIDVLGRCLRGELRWRAALVEAATMLDWSYVLRNHPQGGGDYEGAVYLGLGMLLLVVFALTRAIAEPRVALALLAVAAAVQVIDTRAGWHRALDGTWNGPRSAEWPGAMQSPFWSAAGTRYAKLRWAPPGNAGPHWRELGRHAGDHGMATDAVYLARERRRAARVPGLCAVPTLSPGAERPWI